ncbi:MAG: ATP-binding protein, partial [Deltaproteobacteria bacterium]|nr:ATP-binding protein [Kofleriaceae bacterium]
MSGHLRAAGNEVVISDSASAARDLLGAHAVDLAFVDVAAAQPHDVVTAARDRAPVVVLATGGDPQVMLDFVCELEVEHFLARSDEGDEAFDELAREVVVTAEKLLRRDLFGIEKYLPSFGVELTSFEVKSAEERDDVVECVSDHVAWLGAGSEARRAVAAVVDELVTNAVYDAPRGLDGKPRYAARDRKEKFVLDPWEHVIVRWGSSGDHIAISVSDGFGALRPEHVRACLRRCLTQGDQIEQKAGGAGLGLYTALSYCTQLVVNIEHGRRTELIALIDLRRGQAVRRGGRSLHVFCDDPRANAVAGDAVPAKVEISPSMLVELREQLAP